MHTLSFHMFTARLPPVTLSNPMFACLPFWTPIITHLPGTWGVEAILETKSRAHHIGSTDHGFGCLPMWVPLPPQRCPKLAEALLGQLVLDGKTS
ncbi:hypothetical protein F5888DRAFT_1133159 [Russula emetica]|nr:hypothetical protein F5888DRAFT_1133159 [Russula emetica]